MMTDPNDSIVVAKTEQLFDIDVECERTCNPEGVADYLLSQAVANYTMNRAFDPELPSEVTVQIIANCKGPKKTLFRGFRCPLKAACDLRAGFDADNTTE